MPGNLVKRLTPYIFLPDAKYKIQVRILVENTKSTINYK